MFFWLQQFHTASWQSSGKFPQTKQFIHNHCDDWHAASVGFLAAACRPWWCLILAHVWHTTTRVHMPTQRLTANTDTPPTTSECMAYGFLVGLHGCVCSIILDSVHCTFLVLTLDSAHLSCSHPHFEHASNKAFWLLVRMKWFCHMLSLFFTFRPSISKPPPQSRWYTQSVTTMPLC